MPPGRGGVHTPDGCEELFRLFDRPKPLLLAAHKPRLRQGVSGLLAAFLKGNTLRCVRDRRYPPRAAGGRLSTARVRRDVTLTRVGRATRSELVRLVALTTAPVPGRLPQGLRECPRPGTSGSCPTPIRARVRGHPSPHQQAREPSIGWSRSPAATCDARRCDIEAGRVCGDRLSDNLLGCISSDSYLQSHLVKMPGSQRPVHLQLA